MKSHAEKLAYIAKWQKNNKEKVTQYKRKWRQNNKEYMNKWLRNDYRKNPKKYIEKTNQWRKKYPEKQAILQKTRFARMRASGKISTSVVRQLKLEQPFCVYCSKKSEHLDHIIPVCKGGTNDRSNLQMLCAHCNCKKATKERRIKNSNVPRIIQVTLLDIIK